MAEKPAEPIKRDIRKEIILILEDVVRQLMTIPFPEKVDPKQDQPEFMTMHWCPQHGYHKVKEL